MSTTDLFVELIVVGCGAFAALLLLLLAVFGVDSSLLQQLLGMPVLALPALVLIYLLGILTDRFADRLFNKYWVAAKQQQQYPGGQASFHKDKTLVLAKSERFAALYEYSRSRQRICRGWALNALLLLSCAELLLFTRFWHLPQWWLLSLTLLLLLAALCWCCCYAWLQMLDTELRRVHEQASLLRSSTEL
ncbi:hypothetical protein [Rheinheimera sp. 4Y26]|uniref:hypothetical protein n=1 Tax=Rheinheimera sp. 4Y26 TaxID=2977811 RepID=UPI0021B10D31|nr:hypothetical protein [Rheinheimera sp. 4Y26]MCT6700517.1 hypothetical protein [Rheinheimera sp. 4Y26]